MVNKTEKAKNTVAKTKGKIIFLPYEGVVVKDENGVFTPFKFGMHIPNKLIFSYVLENGNYEDNSNPLYMFFDERFRVWTERDKKTIIGMSSSISFILKEYELIGMDFEELLQLKLLHLDYVDNDFYFPGNGSNFRHYILYHNLEHELSIYVWRGKIREVTLRDTFFEKKNYENPQYLERYGIKKVED